MLTVNSIVVAYSAAPVLREVSLDVSAGEIVSLIGANGAGKTTLMKTLSGLLACIRGTITFGDRNLTTLSPAEIVRAGISQVPEGRRVFREMSVQENLEMGAYSRHHGADIAGELTEIFSIFPILRERRGQLAETLSGGEQQMLAIGRALMAKPKLLLLDEPSMGLAPKMVARIFEVIAEIRRRGTTVFLVEQNAAMALHYSDRAYVIETGRILMAGPSKDLAGNPRVAAAYLGKH
ncbi:MAG: ABC transporter ATP-binding protein [Burkholderiales bacterium]|nr:ABC transporter ATP-binding protein [Burkholderiales bacterium]